MSYFIWLCYIILVCYMCNAFNTLEQLYSWRENLQYTRTERGARICFQYTTLRAAIHSLVKVFSSPSLSLLSPPGVKETKRILCQGGEDHSLTRRSTHHQTQYLSYLISKINIYLHNLTLSPLPPTPSSFLLYSAHTFINIYARMFRNNCFDGTLIRAVLTAQHGDVSQVVKIVPYPFFSSFSFLFVLLLSFFGSGGKYMHVNQIKSNEYKINQNNMK